MPAGAAQGRLTPLRPRDELRVSHLVALRLTVNRTTTVFDRRPDASLARSENW
jgi:hypothetical protein